MGVKLFSYGSLMLPDNLVMFEADVLCSCFLPGFKLVVEKSPITKTNYHYIKLVVGEATDIIPGYIIEIPDNQIEEVDKWEGASYKRIPINPYDRRLNKLEAFTYISS